MAWGYSSRKRVCMCVDVCLDRLVVQDTGVRYGQPDMRWETERQRSTDRREWHADKLARPVGDTTCVVVHTWPLSLLRASGNTVSSQLCVLVILHIQLQHFLSTLPHFFLQASLFSAVGVVHPRPGSKINWCVIPRRNTFLSIIFVWYLQRLYHVDEYFTLKLADELQLETGEDAPMSMATHPGVRHAVSWATYVLMSFV